MKRHIRKHTSEFKARVALEAIKGLKTMNEIAAEYEIHPVMDVRAFPLTVKGSFFSLRYLSS